MLCDVCHICFPKTRTAEGAAFLSDPGKADTWTAEQVGEKRGRHVTTLISQMFRRGMMQAWFHLALEAKAQRLLSTS